MIRSAVATDVAGITAFGEEVVPAHHAPLIGAVAAQAQVSRWWDADSIESGTAGEPATDQVWRVRPLASAGRGGSTSEEARVT